MDYFIYVATIFGIYAILGVSLNLVVGYAGLLSITHAAFFGIGAYASALAATKLEANFFLALIIGIGVAALISYGDNGIIEAGLNIRACVRHLLDNFFLF